MRLSRERDLFVEEDNFGFREMMDCDCDGGMIENGEVEKNIVILYLSTSNQASKHQLVSLSICDSRPPLLGYPDILCQTRDKSQHSKPSCLHKNTKSAYRVHSSDVLKRDCQHLKNQLTIFIS